MRRPEFTLDDFMAQIAQVKKLGSMSRVMEMIPGMSQLTKQMNMGDGDVEAQMATMTAIYNSMNKKERANTDLLDGARRRRIARGAGVELNEVSQFIKQFEMSRDMMRAVGGMGMKGRLGATEQRDLVLGLVTNDPATRDPSCIHPREPRQMLGRLLFIFAMLAVLIVTLAWLFPYHLH